MSEESVFLSPQEVVARYKGQIKSTGTLANWRITKQGPPFTKIGGRVVYPLDRLIEWEKSRTRCYSVAAVAAALAPPWIVSLIGKSAELIA